MNSRTPRWAVWVLVVSATFSLWAEKPQAKKAVPVPAADPAEAGSNRGLAYYHYSLAHLYEELAQYYNRQDYFNKALEHLRLAMKYDPKASQLSAELAELYLHSGRVREAVEEAEEVIRRDPDNLDARRLLGRIYLRSLGEGGGGGGGGAGTPLRGSQADWLKRAVAQFEKISELDPKDAESLLILGRLYRISNDFSKSEAVLKKSLALEPDNEDTLITLANLYSDLGDSRGAVELLERVTRKNTNPRLLAMLGQAYEQARDHSRAVDAFRKALEQDKNNIDYLRSLGQNLLYSEQYDEALKAYQAVAEAEPQDGVTFLRLGQIYRQKHQYDQALESLKKAQALTPDSMEVVYNLALLHEVQGRQEEAAKLLKKLLDETAKPAGAEYTSREKTNRAVFVERLGFLYRGLEKYPEAETYFRQMADLDPENSARALAHLVDTLRQARDYKRAREEADAAVKRFPKDTLLRMTRASLVAELGEVDQGVALLKAMLQSGDPQEDKAAGESRREVWIALAQVHERARRWPEAMEAVAEAEKLSPAKEQKEFVYFLRGSILERQKKYDEAEVEFRKALATNPESAMALNYLGYMLADRGVRLDEAVKMITQALGLDPQNGAYMDSLGWAYFKQNKLDLAEQYLLKAAQRVGRDATIRDHLADVYFKTGRVREALREWQRALHEWEQGLPGETDPEEIAKVQKKLEGAKVRLAKESGGAVKQ